uniref:Uncharacterized protein n=1 Tax=Anguilla anguilla TaxID=7936 RepID=A0A0E9RMF3_ANGAN
MCSLCSAMPHLGPEPANFGRKTLKRKLLAKL